MGAAKAGTDSSVPQPEEERDSTVIDAEVRHSPLRRTIPRSAILPGDYRAEPCHLTARAGHPPSFSPSEKIDHSGTFNVPSDGFDGKLAEPALAIRPR